MSGLDPGALTPAERLDVVDHWHWCARNPRLPPDPDLRFRGELGLGTRRAEIVQQAAAQIRKETRKYA